jgi:hypothetical protein
VHDPLAWQMRGQGLTTTGAPLAVLGRGPIRSRTLASLLLGLLFFEIADQQLELLDPLRGAASGRAS